MALGPAQRGNTDRFWPMNNPSPVSNPSSQRAPCRRRIPHAPHPQAACSRGAALPLAFAFHPRLGDSPHPRSAASGLRPAAAPLGARTSQPDTRAPAASSLRRRRPPAPPLRKAETAARRKASRPSSMERSKVRIDDVAGRPW
ncbi:hypothetical protein U9M48_003113 [Paspalum notatum var. saurae]|uniref:Uncharacterized protein n=1 Tax=Paspalum notatum var. saurae TaxID=547442 RepID=A0AAQ3PQG6_PASNO